VEVLNMIMLKRTAAKKVELKEPILKKK
jgi:hypothetical protein